MYIAAGILAFLALLLIAPIRLSLRYSEDGLTVRARYLMIRLTLFPFKEKVKKAKPERARRKKAKPKKAEKPEKKQKRAGLGERLGQLFKDDGVSGIISLLSELIKLATDTAKKTMAATVIDRLDVMVITDRKSTRLNSSH